MKNYVLVLLAVASTLAAHAQEYYLDLRHQPLAVPGRTVAVEQVLDGRREQSPIGYVYRGLSNEHVLAVSFRAGVGPELTRWLQHELPARPADHPLVLCLRALHLHESRVLGVESAEAYVNFDAYLHQPDGYHFVQSVAAHTSASALDVTGLHAGHLARLLEHCLSQLSGADWAAPLAQPARALAQLPADVPPATPRRAAGGAWAAQAAILRERPRRGLYRSFAQFVANQPDTIQAFRLDTLQPQLRSYSAWKYWQRVPWVRPVVPGPLGQWVEPAGVWGFSDGQALFVQHEQHYFPLLRHEGSFSTVGTAPLDKKYMRAASAAAAHMAYSMSPPALMPNTTDVPVGYTVDMATGALTPYPGLSAPTRPDTAYMYVYRPAQASGPPQVQVWLNGKAAGTLRPGEYLELPWTYYATLVNLCLTDGAQGSACQYLVPDTTRPNYLRVSLSPAAPLWQWVPAAQGAAELDALDALRK